MNPHLIQYPAVLAMTQPPTEGGRQPGMFESLFFPLAMTFAIIYFFMLRPQQKRTDTHKKLVEGLKKGDYVLANAGFYGRVVEVEAKTVMVEVASNVKIRMLKDAVAALGRPDEEPPK